MGHAAVVCGTGWCAEQVRRAIVVGPATPGFDQHQACGSGPPLLSDIKRAWGRNRVSCFARAPVRRVATRYAGPPPRPPAGASAARAAPGRGGAGPGGGAGMQMTRPGAVRAICGRCRGPGVRRARAWGGQDLPACRRAMRHRPVPAPAAAWGTCGARTGHEPRNMAATDQSGLAIMMIQVRSDRYRTHAHHPLASARRPRCRRGPRAGRSRGRPSSPPRRHRYGEAGAGVLAAVGQTSGRP